MRTEIELIKAVVEDPRIAEKFKVAERAKLDTCNRCPDKAHCWGCGVWEWWKKWDLKG
jgi:hypothetical protein